MRYELKSIPIWPFVKVSFFINLIGGFILGFFYGTILSLIFAVMSELPVYQGEDLQFDALPTGIFVIFMPFFMAFMMAFFNTLVMVVVALIYNLIAKLVGGIELNLQPADTPVTNMVQARPTAAYEETDPYRTPPPPPSWHQASPPPAQEISPKPETQAPEKPDQTDETGSTGQD